MNRTHGFAWIFAWAALSGGTACGESQGRVLERTPEIVAAGGSRPLGPPGSNLRVDVLMARSTQTCAIGQRCREDGERGNCFELFHDPRVEFRPDTLEFVPQSDPRVTMAEHRECFRLTLDSGAVATVASAFTELRNDVYELSQGEINLDVRLHDVPELSAGFARDEPRYGIFLLPGALTEVGIPRLSRDTDLVFAVTGPSDMRARDAPVMEHCILTRRSDPEFAGSTYSWLTPDCARRDELFDHLLYQIYLGLERINGFEDLYGRDYPNRCGDGEQDPALWFPLLEDCRVDPDSPSCGEPECDQREFAGHLLTVHWPRGRGYVGNRCRNGLLDGDETAIDAGGVCDLLGR